MTSAVAEVVAEQVKAGLDVVTDGELGKVSFLTYVKDRLGGFDTASGERLMPPSWQVEIDAFPEYYAGYLGKYKDQVSPMTTMVCTGPVSYQGHAQLQTDIANLRAALAGQDVGAVTEAFLPSTSPSGFGRNEYYPSYGEYLAAVAEALREEYLAIVEAGFLLQVDDPWLIEYLSENPATTPGAAPPRRRAARRGPQPRPARHPGREDPPAHLLRPQPRPARPRPGLPRHRAAHAEDQRRGVLVRGREPAPPARVEDLAGRPAARRARSSSRACSGTPATTSSTPS